MITPTATLNEIRKIGLKALVKELGPVGLIRFLQQFETGQGNYTIERETWLTRLICKLCWIKSAGDAAHRKGNNKFLSVPLQPQDQLVTFFGVFPTNSHNIKLVAGAFAGGVIEAGAAALSPGVLAAPHQFWPIGGKHQSEKQDTFELKPVGDRTGQCWFNYIFENRLKEVGKEQRPIRNNTHASGIGTGILFANSLVIAGWRHQGVVSSV